MRFLSLFAYVILMLPEVMQSGQITLPSYGSDWIRLLIKCRQQLVICPEFTEIWQKQEF